VKPSHRKLDLAVERRRPAIVLRIAGSMDADSASQVRQTLDPIIREEAGPLVVNLDAVEHLDSTGLMLLVDAFGRLSRGKRRLVLATTNGRILKLLQITGLRRVFTIRDDEAAAFSLLAA
jgi:anti-sigma B factor antagonist